MKAIVLLDIPDNQFDGIESPLASPMYANVTLDYGDRILYSSGELKEMTLFVNKEQLKKSILKHFSNSYCASTSMGKVMYENEIIKLIEEN